MMMDVFLFLSRSNTIFHDFLSFQFCTQFLLFFSVFSVLRKVRLSNTTFTLGQ